MEHSVESTCFAETVDGTIKERKEQYEFFYVKLAELTNILVAKFEHVNELPPLEWKIQLGRKVAEIHHNGHTWCYCDFSAVIRKINESKEPVYLGPMGYKWKAWQNNNLQPNEAIIEGTSSNGRTLSAKLNVEGLV